MQELQFDYFRGMEAEQYSFYRVPKVLFTAECFKSLSCEAKVLYGLMLDRISLSIKNRWLDEEDRVYIVFTVEETMELLGCSRQKAVKSIAELDVEKGLGLIEKRRLGLGKPNVIYVKNFMIKECCEQEEKLCDAEESRRCEERFSGSMENELQEVLESGLRKNELLFPGNAETGFQGTAGSDLRNCEAGILRSMENEFQEVPESYFRKYENQISGSMKNRIPEVPESDFQKYENHTSGSLKNGFQEVSEPYFQKYENHTSGSMKSELPEVPESDCNKTDIIKTEFNKTDRNETKKNRIDRILSYPVRSQEQFTEDAVRRVNECRQFVRKNIDYAEHAGEEVDELVELIVEILMMPDHTMVRIGGVDRPASLVKSQFAKLRYAHIEYVVFAMRQNTTKVGNIRAYLLTALYNAPMTMNNYYQARINHDMYG